MHTTRTFLFILCVISACSPAFALEEDCFFSTDIDAVLDRLTDVDALGQVMMLGYEGTEVPDRLLSWIRERNLGGVKIFGWNVNTLKGLTSEIRRMQEAALDSELGIPLLIATDQEGGWVRHVKAETSVTAGNMAIGASGLPYDAFYSGYYIGLELKTLGINMNFAPTVDIYISSDAHVIGPRSFSGDPEQAAQLGVAYYKGLDRAGVIATAKHFPGHGRAAVDSHGAMPVIYVSEQELWDSDLYPYRFLIHEGIPAIMSGHISFPSIDSEGLPATISAYLQGDLLREKLNFQGLAITDDLLMNGVLATGLGIEEVAVRALGAGSDMILLSRDEFIHERVWDRLLTEMKTNPGFRKRVYEGARRVILLKTNYLKNGTEEFTLPDPANIEGNVPHPEGERFFFDLACRSVSVFKAENLPLRNPDEKRILLAGQYENFILQGKSRFPQAEGYYFPYEPFYTAGKEYISQLAALVPAYDTVIFCLANPNSDQVLRALESTISGSATEIIVLSVLTPVYFKNIPWIDSAVAVYGTGKESFRAGFAAVAGDFTPTGSIPFEIE